MARKTTTTDTRPETTETVSKETDEQLAMRAIRGVTGCGTIEAEKRLAALEATDIAAIAAAEKSNARHTVPGILATTQSVKDKATDTSKK